MLHVRRNAIRFRTYFNKFEIRKQLYIVYCIAGILPIFFIGLYLLLSTRNLVLNQHYSQASADNIRVKSIMLDVTISIQNISDDFFFDRDLHTILGGRYRTREESFEACRSYAKVVSTASKYTEISKIIFFYNNETMYDYGHFKKATEEIKATEWYRKAAASWRNHWVAVTTPDALGHPVHELALVRKIPVIGTDDYAVLFIAASGNYLKSSINTSSLFTEVTVNDYPLFYSTQHSNIGRNMGMPIDYDEQYFTFKGITRYNGEEALVEMSTLMMVRSQDKIYIATVDKEAVPNTTRITQVSGLIVLIGLLVPFIMVSIFSKTFSARLKTLRQEMHKVATGQLDIIEDFKGKDELVDLYADLKVMIQNIKRRDEEIYNEKIDKQKLINHQNEMRFEMLASQINPHFLFNTLETIRMKAFSAGDIEVATAIKLLGRSMRHVLETSGKVTTLKAELDYIAVYLDIQKLRFRDRIDYAIHVDEGIDPSKYRILSLLLQPIVENAFIHGLENKESNGFIEIRIRAEENKLVAVVSDNGEGMAEPELNALLDRIRTPDKGSSHKSIGLYNINQRIMLYYGEPYGLDIKSAPGAGTQVFVYLPPDYDSVDQGA